MKRIVCLALALVLCLSAWAVQGQAAEHDSGPELAAGHHEKWIDRLDDLPDYAQEFYEWLERNANAEGALADPTLATYAGGSYFYTIALETNTVQSQCSAEDWETTAYTIATEAMRDDFDRISAYAGEVYDVFDRDHPEVFWLSGAGLFGYAGSYRYSYRNGTVKVNYQIQVMFYLQTPDFDIRYQEYRSPAAVEAGIALRDEAVARILSQCPQTGVYEQLIYLNQVLTEENAYNSAVASGKQSQAQPLSWECLSALQGSAGDGGPVCEGYSRAFMVLCQELEIPCVLVDGVARSERTDAPESHMWNYVKVGGKWYAVDVTWNDPYVRSQPMEKWSGFESEDWLLLGTDSEVAPDFTFGASHVVDNQIGQGRLEYINGPELSRSGYVPGEATGSLGGVVDSSGEDTEEMTIALYLPGMDTPVVQMVLSGTHSSFHFDALENGSYIIKLSKPGHVSREYQVSTEEPLELDLKLCLEGDITGDGRINVADVAKIYAHVRGSNLIEDDYQHRCGDITGDNKINAIDTARAYAKVKKR